MSRMSVKLLLPLAAFLSTMGSSPIVYAQSGAIRLPPPPPLMDRTLQKELANTRKLDKEGRDAIIEQQKNVDRALEPLRPEQMRHIQRNAQENERILNEANGPARELISRDISWSMGAGAKPIHLGVGYTTTILFFDGQGKPLPVGATGAIIGDVKAISPTVAGHALVLTVNQPWKPTNATVFLQNLPVPVQLSMTSDRGAGTAIDTEVRIRVMDNHTAGQTVSQGDTQQVNLLLQMTNGAPASNALTPLTILSTEKGDPNNLRWTRIANNVAQFRQGPDGQTYVMLRPGMKMLYPNTPNIVSSVTGADGTEGYVVSGNNPRMFTFQDQYGAMYRVSLQR